jgi:RNase P protein component
MCLICRFIVMKKRMNQYSRRIGQKTGTSNMGKKVTRNPIKKDFVEDHL